MTTNIDTNKVEMITRYEGVAKQPTLLMVAKLGSLKMKLKENTSTN